MSFFKMIRVCTWGAALVVATAAGANAAVLDGQSVDVSFHSLDTGGNAIDTPGATVTAPGTATFDGGFLSATYTDHQITLTDPFASSSVSFLTSNFLTGVPFVFNGLVFQTAPVITSVVLDPAETVTPVGLSFTNNEIFLDLKGLSISAGDTIILDLNPGRAVPEPGVWAMMLVGFGVLGAGLRRRREAGAVAAA